MLVATAAYLLCIVTLFGLERQLAGRFDEVEVTQWVVDHVALPLLRLAAVMVFLLCAYPGIYGWSQAPDLHGLLFGPAERFYDLINLFFLLGLILPLLSPLHRLPGLIVPLQAILAITLVYVWAAHAAGFSDVPLWPGWAAPLQFAALSLAAWGLANFMAKLLQDRLDHEHRALADELHEALILLVQAPALYFYGRALGRALV